MRRDSDDPLENEHRVVKESDAPLALELRNSGDSAGQGLGFLIMKSHNKRPPIGTKKYWHFDFGDRSILSVY